MDMKKKQAAIRTIGYLFIGLSFNQGYATASLSLDELIPKYPGKDYSSIVQTIVEQYSDVITYIGVRQHACFTYIRRAIQDFPSLMLITIDAQKYPSFNVMGEFSTGNGPALSFYKNGVICKTTTFKTAEDFTRLLKEYYQ
jgi:hypothetical protein